MAALERSRGKEIAENLGVSEDTIERLRIHDWAIFNSDRRYYEKLQEAGTYLEEVAESAPQSGVKTVDDFLDSIENDRLYEILIEVDRFKEKLKKFLR
ncbi:RNA polymerase sigma-70 factor, ECF subfamily [Marvinbryantia formatexigens]|nr:RNA polymerase sigma-70 factor, ECF subfamily [Marvinbryantia formatexigens]